MTRKVKGPVPDRLPDERHVLGKQLSNEEFKRVLFAWAEKTTVLDLIKQMEGSTMISLLAGEGPAAADAPALLIYMKLCCGKGVRETFKDLRVMDDSDPGCEP